MKPVLDQVRYDGAVWQPVGRTNFLPKLPDVQTRDVAEKELLRAAEYTGPTTLAKGLRELTDRLCLNETAEERAVRMREGRYLRFTDTIDHMVGIDGMLDRVGATILRKALYPLALNAGEVDEHPGHRNADALIELGRLAMDTGQLPETAGEPTRVIMQTFLSDLLRRLEPWRALPLRLLGTRRQHRPRQSHLQKQRRHRPKRA